MQLALTSSRLLAVGIDSAAYVRFWARRLPRLRAALTTCVLASTLAACAGGDGPTEPTAPPVTPPPAQNPDTPPPAPTTGALIVEIEGAPTGAVPTVVISKSGVQRVVRQSRTVDSLPPGVYEVRAEEIVIDSVRWTPEPIVQSVQVLANQAAPRANVRFRQSGASIILSASGLPAYARSTVRITGPAGMQWTALTRDTVRQLGPGTYTLVAEGVNTTDGRFEATPDTRTVTLTRNATESVSFSFGAPRANLTIAIDGLPNGTLAGVSVAGPAGFSGRADATRTFSGLEAGLYTATAARVVAGGFSYDPNASNRDVTLSGTQSRTLAFNYALATGAIAVTVNGLPNGTNGNVTVTGPAGFSRNVPTTQTLIDLAPGAYRITASTVSANGATFTASPSTIDVVVTPSLVAVPAAVQYIGSMGAMDISVDGLPPTLDASVKITRPNGASFWITASETVENLPIGQYTLDALTVTGPNDSWDPDVSSMKVQVKKNETVSAGVTYSPRKGAMTVSVVGLPSGVAGSVLITGPGSFNQTITGTTTLTNLTAGTYTVQANSVTNGATQYTATPASATVSVTRGNTATHTVSYGGQSTALTVDFSGLPGGTAASATVTGPNGFSRALASATVLENLAPGTYRITTAAVNTSTAMYSASPATADVSLAAGDRKTQQVAYALASGSLAVSVGGLPSGTSGAVTVSGPNGFTQQLTGTQTLTKLSPGNYTIVAADVVASGTTYKATPASRTVTVSASLVAAAAPITYATALGGLRVTLTGLPAQAAGAATLHGPSGATTSLSQTSVTGGLAAGSWEVRGHEVTLNSERYAPTPTTRNVTVVANDTIETSLAFARVTGRLTVNVSGLPNGTSADITVTGPSGFSRVVNSTQTIVGLNAGTYTVSAASVVVGSTNYAPSSASQSVSVTAGGSATSAVVYSGQTTSLAVTVTGVPSGASASIAASGPSGYAQAITGTTTLSGLNSGTYTLTAARIVHGNFGYNGTPATQSVALATGESKSASVAYAVSTGALAVAVSGLPAGVNAPITVTGPSGFSRAVTSSTTLTDLAPGSYTVVATSTTSGSTSFTPSSTSQSVSVTAGATASRAVVFTSSGTALTVNLSGVPSGANGAVTVTGPSGFTRTVTSSTTLTELAAGTYTVAAANITHSGATYTPTPTSQTASLTTGQQLTRTVTYAVSTASLAVTVSDVPSGASAAVTVTGPNNFSQALSASQTLNGLAPGTYTVSAASLVSGGYTYAATPASASVSLVAGDAKSHALTYAASTGRLTVNVSGLPSGTNASVNVTGPSGFSQSVTATTTLGQLAPGTYTVAASNVTSGSTLYTPSSASQTISVTAGATASRSVTYTGASTSLAVTLNGLPSGVNGDVRVTGPSSFSQTLTATTTLNSLAAGTYTIAANNVTSGGYTYGGTPASQTSAVTIGSQQAASVAYAAITGRLTVSVSGLPTGTSAGITVTGPNSYSQQVTAGVTLQNLAPGTYTVEAANVTAGSTLYTPSSTSQSVSVTAGNTLTRTVTYSASVTSLAVSITGLPSGTNAAVAVTGPSFSQNLTAGTTLTGLAAGTYTVTANNVSSGGYTYGGTPASQTASVTVGSQLSRAVAYSAITGRLTVSVSGLPGGTNAGITVSGPSGFSQTVNATTTLSGLAPGSYTVTATTLSSGGTTYTPSSTSQSVSVTAGATASRSVTYTGSVGDGGGGGSPGPNLVVEGAYVTQAIQSFSGDVPLVAGREALLRVFVAAASSNTLTPTVRVRLFTGTTNFRTFTINAPSGSVPTSISEGTLNSSWNATLTESDMRVGLRIQVDVDPTNLVAEPDETDNVWPRTGTKALDVRTVAPFNVVFVPVHQTATGLTGDVTPANLESRFFSMSRRMFPLADINASVRATYTTNAGALQSNDGNFAWLTVLSEINSLRTADGSQAHYYGVVGTSYGSGIAGYAYVPGRAAVGWDKSGSANRVTAHELGHNFSRRHVAACGSGNTDANYPYAGGIISNFGWNSGTNAIVNTTVTDIMGYCGTQWISDYTWSAVMNYRGPAAMVAGFGAGPQPTLMVWGRIKDGVVTLEPAVRLSTTPSVAQRPGRLRLELRDKTGRVLTGFSFDPEVVDHDENASAFAFAVPLSAVVEGRLSSVAIVGGVNGTVEQTARVPMAFMMGDSASAPAQISADGGSATVTDPTPRVSRSGGSTRITWDDQAWPLALVKDAQSGQTLSYLRKSGDGFIPRGSQVRVVFSNGIQSVTKVLSTQ